jgi:hypothetical protein
VSSIIVFLETDAGDKRKVLGTNSERFENSVLVLFFKAQYGLKV